MQRIQEPNLIEKITGRISTGTFFQAKNLDDFVKTLQNHTLTKHREIIRIVFQTPIKLQYENQQEYEELPYFFNDNVNHSKAKQMAEEYIEKEYNLVTAQDSSINEPIFMYSHHELNQRFQENENKQIILPKPFLTFKSHKGIGLGVFNELE